MPFDTIIDSFKIHNQYYEQAIAKHIEQSHVIYRIFINHAKHGRKENTAAGVVVVKRVFDLGSRANMAEVARFIELLRNDCLKGVSYSCQYEEEISVGKGIHYIHSSTTRKMTAAVIRTIVDFYIPKVNSTAEVGMIAWYLPPPSPTAWRPY
jgi:hypothetical protein